MLHVLTIESWAICTSTRPMRMQKTCKLDCMYIMVIQREQKAKGTRRHGNSQKDQKYVSFGEQMVLGEWPCFKIKPLC